MLSKYLALISSPYFFNPGCFKCLDSFGDNSNIFRLWNLSSNNQLDNKTSKTFVLQNLLTLVTGDAELILIIIIIIIIIFIIKTI